MIETMIVKMEWAKKYGFEEAALLWWIVSWVVSNKANSKNEFDGRTWTYNTAEALSKLFTVWSPKQIRRIAESLISQKIILTGNYNKSPYDRTLWYALVDEKAFIPNYDIVKSNSYYEKIDFTETENGNAEKGEPIPVLYQYNTNSNTNTPPVTPPPSKRKELPEWKTNFDKYLELVEKAKEFILADPDLQQRRVLVDFPNLDVKKSLERSIRNFWGTEAGWRNKKKSKAVEIDMVETLIKNIDKNKVWLPFERNDTANEAEEDATTVPQGKTYPGLTVIQMSLAPLFPEGIDYPHFPPMNNEKEWRNLWDQIGRLPKNEQQKKANEVSKVLEKIWIY